VRVELQDCSGEPLPGYTLAEAVECVGDDLERVARWSSGSDVSWLAGQAVRLRLVLKDADVYALQFRQTSPPQKVEP
jgi:hypothetical protein